MEQSPNGIAEPSPRRGPSVDLDPTGMVTGRRSDRQRRQFLTYSFYRLDPVRRRLPSVERRRAERRDAKAIIDSIVAQLANRH
jgi:hypothetical protein